jgi:murein DD-endopeptidase MepM/ murein hydrolase activator NlpD
MKTGRAFSRSIEARSGMMPVAAMSCLFCALALVIALGGAISSGGTLLAARVPDAEERPFARAARDRGPLPIPSVTRVPEALSVPAIGALSGYQAYGAGPGLRAMPSAPSVKRSAAASAPPAAREAAPEAAQTPRMPPPRLKPLRRAEGVTVGKPVSMDAPVLAGDMRYAFASRDDISGGRKSLFDDYAEVRARLLEEDGYRPLLMPKGGSLLKLLQAEGLDQGEVAGALSALSTEVDLRRITPGTAIEIALEPSRDTVFQVAAGAPPERLARLRLQPEPGKEIVAWASRDGWQVRKAALAVETRYATAASMIEDSLFAAGRRAAVPQEVMIRLANLFLYDVDFARDIRRGDRFEVVYEVHHDEKGRAVGTGDIVFAALSWRGGQGARGYYLFEEEGGEPAYFDATGRSARRLLMKTPIEGARVTSGFGRRRHPISGYTRKHKGIDFGARSGTPIMAAGDGVVEIAGPRGPFGNYVRLRHSNGYETAYAHLNGFARGLKAGQRVRQGQVIGYVGSTGASTGPHLHYEVHHRGEALNPMALEIAGGTALDGEALAAFEEGRRLADTLRVRPFAVAMATGG